MQILFLLFLINFSDESGTGSEISKNTGCKTLLTHRLEKTTMECRQEEVVYVQEQVFIPGHPSIGGSFKTCFDESESGGCTLILPRNKSKERGNLFPIGNICNLRVTCVLDDSLLTIPVVLNDSDCSPQEFKSTSFTYTCIQNKHIINLLEKGPHFSERIEVNRSNVYLVVDSFSGNISCDVAGPIRYLYILELKETTLDVHSSSDDQQLYKSDYRDIYGEDISLFVVDSNCATCMHSLTISSLGQGRLWIHLKGDGVLINCTRFPSGTYTETAVNSTKFDGDAPYIKDSSSRLFVLIVSGLVLAFVLMAGIHVMQRRKDLHKLKNLVQPNDRISIVFGDHVTDATENANIYSEISSTRTMSP